MKLEIGKIYSGFKLLNQEEIKEVNSVAQIFIHEKSGAKLLFLDNNDDNKVFSISFKTPPKDSTGVAHILEHSVLCGSRKFPVKEPFVELIKGSLNTFLNAMTFPDKTMYPIASKNDKDFVNLMDVYLDAVFYPNIYKSPEIMMQEGWHYEIENKEDDLQYKGVVYNEMKGAFSSPDSILFRKIQESLYPDNSYGVESGGDPDSIPDLTQEAFLNFHKKYYHPSNSYIYLYGNMDILDKLQFINENYLDGFNKIDVDSKIDFQEPFDNMKYLDYEYPISNSEEEKDKTYLSLNYSVGKSKDTELYLALEILEYLLLETSSSPLKKALIDSKIGKDVFGMYDNSVLQPTFSVIAKNSNEDKKEEFKDIILKTLERLVEEGIDKKLIESAINIKEFNLREADYQGYPKGLIYNIKCMDSWLYGENPYMHLEYEHILKKIKESVDNRYFENLIKKYLIQNKHCSIVTIKPKKGLEGKRKEKIKEKLANYKNSLSNSEIEKLIENTKKLQKRQTTKDSEEDLNKIPLLSIDDIDKNSKKLALEEKSIEKIKTLHHNIFTNKISYVNLYFNTTCVQQEDIPYIALLSSILGRVSTEKYNYDELSNEININTGGIKYTTETFSEKGNADRYNPMLAVKAKCLSTKLNHLIELIGEVICNSKFTEKDKIREVIQELKSRLEMVMLDRGHSVAVKRLFSYFSDSGKYEEMLSGIGFYKFICDIDKNFDSQFENIRYVLADIYNKIFNKNNLLISITCEHSEYSGFEKEIKPLIDRLNEENLKYNKYKFKFNKNEGFTTSSKVQYVAKGYNFIKLGYEYSGSLQVLRSLINYDYLWNKIRVQGGAYGSFSGFIRNGNMFFASYRDPNLKETLNAYDGISTHLKDVNVNDREMTKYIIGTISDVDMPLTPSQEGQKATENYMRKVSYEDIQNERRAILSTNKNTLKAFTPMLKDTMKDGYICVLGNEDKIEDNKDQFDYIVNLFD